MRTTVLNHRLNSYEERSRAERRTGPCFLSPFPVIFCVWSSKRSERHPVMISCTQCIQSHIPNHSPPHTLLPSTISSLSAHSFSRLTPPPFVILLLPGTHQSLVPSFSRLSFQMKTRLTRLVTMTHGRRLPPHPIYSACLGQFSPRLCLLLPPKTPPRLSFHPSSRSSEWLPHTHLYSSFA